MAEQIWRQRVGRALNASLTGPYPISSKYPARS
jgi:hypothetical protein